MKQRTRYVSFYNPELNKVSTVDTFALRTKKMRASVMAWAAITDTLMQEHPGYKRCMITLTYDTQGTLTYNPEDWREGDIKRCLDNYTRKHKHFRVVAYAWVLELQEKGTPHYHIMVIYTGHIPYPDKSGYWSHGMSNVKWKIRTSFYLVTYLKKKYQKSIDLYPQGARSYGVSFSDPNYRHKHRLSLLSPSDKEIVEREGFEHLKEFKKRPEWLRSQYIGSAVTPEFADWQVAQFFDGR